MIPLWKRLVHNHSLRTKLTQKRPNIYARLFTLMVDDIHDLDDIDELDARDDELALYDSSYELLTLSPALRNCSDRKMRALRIKEIVVTHFAGPTVPTKPPRYQYQDPDEPLAPFTYAQIERFNDRALNVLVKLPRDDDGHVHRSTYVAVMEHFYQILLPGMTASGARCLGRADFVEVCRDRRTMSPDVFMSSMMSTCQLWCDEGAGIDGILVFLDTINEKLFESKCSLVSVLYYNDNEFDSDDGSDAVVHLDTTMIPDVTKTVTRSRSQLEPLPSSIVPHAPKMAYSGALGKVHSNWDLRAYHALMPKLSSDIARKIKVSGACHRRETDERHQVFKLQKAVLGMITVKSSPTPIMDGNNNSRSVSVSHNPHREDLQLRWIAKARSVGMSVRDFCHQHDLDLNRFNEWLAYEANYTKVMRKEIKMFIESGIPSALEGTVDSQALICPATYALREEWRQRSNHEGLDYDTFCDFFGVSKPKFLQWYANPNDLSPEVQRAVIKYVFVSPDVQSRWKNCAERRKVSPVMFCASYSFGVGHFMHWLEGGATPHPDIIAAVWAFLRQAGESMTGPVNRRNEAQPFPSREKYSIEKAIGALPMRHAETECNASSSHKAVRSLIAMMKKNTIPVRHQARIRNALMKDSDSNKM